MHLQADFSGKRIYTVTELTRRLRQVVEATFPLVWVAGEVSDFRSPLSGHYYFTLKDEAAQIRAVMFRAQNRALRFKLEDGLSVTVLGRLTVYEVQGVYQIIVEHLEPAGLGALQLALEQLKTRLAAEGLFDQRYKQPLPFLPSRIAVVTSPTGAVIRDILHVLNRRFPNVAVDILPVSVQGSGAAEQIASAVRRLNELGQWEVIILARGGGSLEDLQAFNSEIVARAVFASQIPIVSAVGHETDVTICDLVADVRAPTPSAAAEIVVPDKAELKRRLRRLNDSLALATLQRIRFRRQQHAQLSRRIIHPRARIADCRIRLDHAMQRLLRDFAVHLDAGKNRLRLADKRLRFHDPRAKAANLKVSLKHSRTALAGKMRFYLQAKKHRLSTAMARLSALSPLAVLERGFSVTRALPDYDVVKDVVQVALGQEVEVTVFRGAMVCRVERKYVNGEADI